MINKTTLYTSANCGGTTLVIINLIPPKTVNARTTGLETVFGSSPPNEGNEGDEYTDGFPTDPNGEDWRDN